MRYITSGVIGAVVLMSVLLTVGITHAQTTTPTPTPTVTVPTGAPNTGFGN